MAKVVLPVEAAASETLKKILICKEDMKHQFQLYREKDQLSAGNFILRLQLSASRILFNTTRTNLGNCKCHLNLFIEPVLSG